jgi:hypothetical protein
MSWLLDIAKHKNVVFSRKLNIQALLCSTWDRIEASTPSDPQRDVAIANINGRVKCP